MGSELGKDASLSFYSQHCVSYPIDKPLIELLHRSLKLTALKLPLFVISDRL